MGKQTVVPQKLIEEQKLARLRKKAEDNLTRLLVRPLARTSITPNAVSWFGLLLTLGAGALIVSEHFIAAAFAVVVAGLFDMLDGALARSTNRVTKFGAFSIRRSTV